MPDPSPQLIEARLLLDDAIMGLKILRTILGDAGLAYGAQVATGLIEDIQHFLATHPPTA
jgi:hypothetical protein